MTMSEESLTKILVHMMEQQRVPKPTTCEEQATDKPRPSMNVQVRVKVNYGTEHFYPANPTADLFLRIQGGKTLTKATLKVLKDEGYTIQYTYEEPAL